MLCRSRHNKQFYARTDQIYYSEASIIHILCAMSENLRLNHRRSSARAFPDFPHTCVFSFNGENHILTDKANALNKISVPIKEYSNKFFRESCSHLLQTPIKKVDTPKRFNVILKKKQLLLKNTPKIPTPFEDHSMELPRNQAQDVLKVSRVKHLTTNKRVQTEAAMRGEKPSANESVLTQLQNQLLLSTTLLSNLLNPETTNLRETTHLQAKEHPASAANKHKSRSVSLPCEQKEKISQSRGLEIYSKIFVRNRSRMIEKDDHYPKKTMATTCHHNHFQTRRIFPVTKSRKGIQFDRKMIQTASSGKPFRSTRNKPYKTLEYEEENFELRGWDTNT